MTKIFTTAVCLLLLVAESRMAVAQTNPSATQAAFIVRGKVTDGKEKTPIEGVLVAEMDKEDRIVKGVTTDIEGNYALKMSNPKNRISVSFIGYKTETFATGGKTVHNISLSHTGKDMDEVIVVSDKKTNNGMMSVSDKYRTTAAASISAKEMEEMQASSIDQALQGRLPGVDITASSGDPGAALSIKIRGTSSINSSDNPLIVVDGMPYETTVPPDFNFGTADEQGYAALLNIAPSDIKDITVLKDAAATAVWGSQAASGVLIINTKRGTVSPPTLTYTMKASISKAQKNIPMLNGDQYSMLVPEMVMNRNGVPLNTQTQKEFSYDPTDPYWYYNYSNNTDWVKAVTRLGTVQDHNLSMTGGGQKARYFVSVGYFDYKGVTVGTGLSRINTRINLDYNVSDRIKFRTDLAYTHTDNARNYVNSNDNADNIRNIAYLKLPNMSIYEYDKFGNLTPNYFSPPGNIQGQYAGTYNPVAMANAAVNKIISQRVIPHFNITYDIIPKKLMLTSDVQFDISNNKNNSFLPQVATGRPWTETVVNRAYDGDADGFNVITKTNLSYTPVLPDKHNLIMFASLITNDNKYVSQQAIVSNLASSVLQDPSVPGRTSGNGLNVGSSITQTRSVGLLLNSQYSFLNRYIINASIRGDGNSRFGPNHRYGLFPAVSTRWRAADEPFMKPTKKWLDDLSVRGSYGHSGRAPRYDYGFYNAYSAYGYTYLGESGVFPASMRLNNLTWETNKGLNLGFNLVVLQRRLNVDVDFYRNRITDMFYSGLQISSFTGFNAVDMNVGTMDNQGWEVGLTATVIKKKDLMVDLNFNISHNDNLIREISEFYPRERGNIEANGQYKALLQENNPFGSFYGFKFKGVYKDREATIARDKSGKPIVGPNGQTVYQRFNYPKVDYVFQPGDAMYEDINHDGNIDYMDVVYLGNSNPKFTGGFGTTITYKKNLKLTFFFNYRMGGDLINGTKMSTTAMYNYNNQSTAVLRRWRKEGDITDIPRALYGTGYNWLGSDRYVEDGSFVRFRTVTMRYTLPKTVTDRLRLKMVSAYLTAENLFTFTRYSGQDPEASLKGSDPFRVVTDYSMTPPPFVLTFGLTTTF
ncbi:TonB-linked SusC/RagA family outer membrane protein [Filimonas zeae]|uniref:SusC/RagA family TonB-linked outer membrane protein n=1 Tax=Filimonas zeae TaxID=1737353 RepID=A0A917IMZ3_9BACT|nr:SusC/RagA family TonB-linked outer membrane protein [Filimonas zeae]MDR6337213.1 TonB-linked SusC/RagA family outer membrane protein [Filimonas zeae]GGH57522.1 SusC/RagA family TonB-linked outer membrane protein [Filimonas zeae]